MFGVSKKIQVNLYADEIKPFKNSKGEKWMYIGVLAIPEDKRITIQSVLDKDRRSIGYHSPLHFTEITQHAKFDLASKWLDRVKFDKWKDPVPPQESKGFYFQILGINFSNLQHQVFGERGSKHEENIYNRFFRTAITSTLRFCYRDYDSVEVLKIYHHAGHMENNDLFWWHPIWKIDRKYENIQFYCSEIDFIVCNKNSPGQTEITSFIQLIDLILGSARQSLDYTSGKQWQIKIAQVLRPLFASLVEKQRYKERSEFNAIGRCSISFFPSRKLSYKQLDDEQLKAKSSFYQFRPLQLPPGKGDFQQIEMEFFK